MERKKKNECMEQKKYAMCRAAQCNRSVGGVVIRIKSADVFIVIENSRERRHGSNHSTPSKTRLHRVARCARNSNISMPMLPPSHFPVPRETKE